MPGGLTLLAGTAASIPTPPAGKVTIFFNTDTNLPSYKDSAGIVHGLVGSQGVIGATGIQGEQGDEPDQVIAIPGPTGNPGPTGATGPVGPMMVVEEPDVDEQILMPSGGGAAQPASLSIAQAAQPGTLNVTTEGTIDWLVPNGTTTIPRQLGSSTYHTKVSSGLLGLGFDWIVNGGTVFTQNDGVQMTSTLNDDTANAALAASVASQGVFIAAGIGPGWRFSIPSSIDRVSTLKIYCGTFSAEITVIANLPYHSLTQSLTFDPGAGASLARMLTITFKGHGFLNVKAQITVNRGSTPNIKMQGATLA